MTPSCAIVTSSGICRPSSSPLVLRDQSVLCRVSLVWVFSRLSWYPSPRSAVGTVEYAHADRKIKRNKKSDDFTSCHCFLILDTVIVRISQ